MSQPERTESGKVTLEDLLRVKRAERPSPEFWVRFDQELRAKQLAAAIEKRPWWVALRFPEIARWISRYQFPLGASAALVLGFVSFRAVYPTVPGSAFSESHDPVVQATAHPERGRFGSAPDFSQQPASAPILATVDPLRTTSVLHTPAAEREWAEAPVSVSIAEAAEVASVAEPVDSAAPAGPGALLAMVPWAPRSVSFEDDAAASRVSFDLSIAPFAHLMVPTRDAAFESNEGGLDPVVMSVRTPAAKLKPSDAVTVVAAPPAPVAPETPVTKPATAVASLPAAPHAGSLASRREVRRDRILSTLIAEVSGNDEHSRVPQVREALIGALDEDRFSGTVRRLGMGGDRVILKF